MKRRKFLKNTVLSSAALGIPFILPGGRLFAATGSRKANHVVLCLFAGGVRNIESMYMAEGNLLPNMLPGVEQISKDIASGMTPLPLVNDKKLTSFGTLFKEFRFAQGPTGHISAHLTTISGKYDDYGYNPKNRPPNPTIFEYHRKHAAPVSPLNSWWIADRADPFCRFNYSTHQRYGADYAANYLQPANIIRSGNSKLLGEPELFSDIQQEQIARIRNFAKRNRSGHPQTAAVSYNNKEESTHLEKFIRQSIADATAGQYEDPWRIGTDKMNRDMYNMFFATKVLEHFKPELLVVNILEIDRGHTDFTLYCDNMRKADFALAHLWKTIQETDGMKDNTVLIVVPEHGRNLKPNTLKDKFGRFALDHTSDPTSREIFCLIVGPSGVVRQNQLITNKLGESIDIVPTIAYALGFHDDLPFYLKGRPLKEAFIS